MSNGGGSEAKSIDEKSPCGGELENVQFPAEEKIITTDMLDERIARINSLIHSKDCLLPKTIDASMEECDEFLNLVTKFLDQKLLMARKCIHMSHFVEDIHALGALAITPALVLAIFAFLAQWSGSFKTSTSGCDSPSSFYFIPQELRPFAFSCVPLVIYLLYVYFVAKSQTVNDELVGGPIDIDAAVASIYPRLKSLSDLFHDNARRQRFLFCVYAFTGLWGVYLLGTSPLEIVSRLCGLLMVLSVNFMVGLVLTTFPTFANSLHPFYTPLERNIRIVSFSPILYAVLTAIGTLFVPIITRHVDYNNLRELSIQVISLVQKKFKGVLAVQKGMRNVRELLKVTTHFQDLAQGLASLEVNREAGRAIVSEVPKVASKLFQWASGTLVDHLNNSPARRQSRENGAPLQDEAKEDVVDFPNNAGVRNSGNLEEID